MKIKEFISNYKTLTIDEKINFKDYFKEYRFNKNNILKQDINYFSIENLYNNCSWDNIFKVDDFISGYGIFSPYMN